jgi:hypothetical protein
MRKQGFNSLKPEQLRLGLVQLQTQSVCRVASADPYGQSQNVKPSHLSDALLGLCPRGGAAAQRRRRPEDAGPHHRAARDRAAGLDGYVLTRKGLMRGRGARGVNQIRATKANASTKRRPPTAAHRVRMGAGRGAAWVKLGGPTIPQLAWPRCLARLRSRGQRRGEWPRRSAGARPLTGRGRPWTPATGRRS